MDKVKAFLSYFARKKYENGQEKNEFFNSFINRIILYDDKILIFYNTGENNPTVIKRKDTKELVSHLNDIASNDKAATNDCLNATGNNSLIVQNKNSLDPQGFKRVSLGGERGIRTPVRVSAVTRFRIVRIQPLCHLSKKERNKPWQDGKSPVAPYGLIFITQSPQVCQTISSKKSQGFTNKRKKKR